VLDTYLEALECLPKDLELHSILFTGPELPLEQREILDRRRRQIASRFPWTRSVQLLEFSPRLLDFMAASDLIVARGGYNTVTEILSLGRRALIVPRVAPNLEQLTRASLFEERGLIRMLHPDHLSPRSLAEALLAALRAAPPSRQHLQAAGLDLNGLHQVKTHVVRLLRYQAKIPSSRYEG
jgi:predicted glycosyltransferase